MVEERDDEERPRPVPSLSSSEERERAILGVLRERKEKEEAAEEARKRMARDQRRPFPSLRHLVLALTLAAASYVWLGSPTWTTPPAPTAPGPEQVEASLRLALYVQAQRIEAFRRNRGRLPRTTSEIGPPIPGVRYSATERGTYHLEGIGGGTVLFLSSSAEQSPEAFLGNAPSVLFEDMLSQESEQ